MKRKSSRKRRTVAHADSYLQLDAISGSRDPEVQAFYARAHEEEFNKYFDWLERHASADGSGLTVPAELAQAEFQKAMDRVHARAGYRFIHLLPPLMRQRLREVYPLPPLGGCELQPAPLGLAG